jgi:hypothetical protein
MTFGRKGRRTPLTKEVVEEMENLRDDCIALFLASKKTQKEVHEQGGPTPGTISKWLYRETFFPRYDTIHRLLRALGYGLAPVHLDDVSARRSEIRVALRIPFNGGPRMPAKKGAKR